MKQKFPVQSTEYHTNSISEIQPGLFIVISSRRHCVGERPV